MEPEIWSLEQMLCISGVFDLHNPEHIMRANEILRAEKPEVSFKCKGIEYVVWKSGKFNLIFKPQLPDVSHVIRMPRERDHTDNPERTLRIMPDSYRSLTGARTKNCSINLYIENNRVGIIHGVQLLFMHELITSKVSYNEQLCATFMHVAITGYCVCDPFVRGNIVEAKRMRGGETRCLVLDANASFFANHRGRVDSDGSIEQWGRLYSDYDTKYYYGFSHGCGLLSLLINLIFRYDMWVNDDGKIGCRKNSPGPWRGRLLDRGHISVPMKCDSTERLDVTFDLGNFSFVRGRRKGMSLPDWDVSQAIDQIRADLESEREAVDYAFVPISIEKLNVLSLWLKHLRRQQEVKARPRRCHDEKISEPPRPATTVEVGGGGCGCRFAGCTVS